MKNEVEAPTQPICINVNVCGGLIHIKEVKCIYKSTKFLKEDVSNIYWNLNFQPNPDQLGFSFFLHSEGRGSSSNGRALA